MIKEESSESDFPNLKRAKTNVEVIGLFNQKKITKLALFITKSKLSKRYYYLTKLNFNVYETAPK